jgi:hypothetical protein
LFRSTYLDERPQTRQGVEQCLIRGAESKRMREAASMLVVLGLMAGFGLGAAYLASVVSDVPSVTILPSFVGGMLFGALAGVLIVLSRRSRSWA